MSTNFGFVDVCILFSYPPISVSIVSFPEMDMTDSLKLPFVYLFPSQNLVFPMFYG